MPFSLRKLSKLNLVALCVVALIGIATFGFGFRDWFSRPTPMATLLPTQDTKKKERIPSMFLTLTRFGFQPSVIEVTEGDYLLVVRDISGSTNVQLELTSLKNDKLVSEKKDEGKPFWEKPLNLKAGGYKLVVQEKPEWVCTLTVLTPVKK